MAKKPAWNADLYARQFGFVAAKAADLVDLLDPKPGERILDLGCGTGELTAALAARGAAVLGLDSSPDMLAKARRAYPEITFIEGDATDFAVDAPLDGVFSNAALHWMRPPENVVESIAAALRPGGRFVAEFGGKHNTEAVMAGLALAFEANGLPIPDVAGVWFFPDIIEYGLLLQNAGLEVVEASLRDRPTALEGGEQGLRHWLEMFGGLLFAGVEPARKQAIYDFTAFVLRDSLFHRGQWYVDYRRLRVKAVRGR